MVAAHTLLLLNPPFPNPILKDLIIKSYPSLAVHARLVLSQAFPDPTVSPTNPTFGSNSPRSELSDMKFAKMRWVVADPSYSINSTYQDEVNIPVTVTK